MKERIFQLIRRLGISARQFSLSIGKSESFARTINRSIGSDVIGDILRVYPDVNLYWLISGEGPILKSEMTKTSESVSNFNEIIVDQADYIRLLREENRLLKHELKEKSERLSSVSIKNKLYTSTEIVSKVADSDDSTLSHD